MTLIMDKLCHISLEFVSNSSDHHIGNHQKHYHLEKLHMARAIIEAGICGYSTTVETTSNGNYEIGITIESECKAIQRMGENLVAVNALNEISFRGGKMPVTIEKGIEYCSHAACPVPAGVIKAVEIEAGLALPKDVSIKLEK
jgi:hypothetical protein